MRPSLFACTALAAALALSACQPRAEAPAEPASTAAPAASETPAGPAMAPTSAQTTVQPSASPQEPQARIPEGQDMRPERVPASDTACREQIGEAAAARLVERCIHVSPATRPPCNAANPCDLIQGEIDRSCKLWERDGDTPAECRS